MDIEDSGEFILVDMVMHERVFHFGRQWNNIANFKSKADKEPLISIKLKPLGILELPFVVKLFDEISILDLVHEIWNVFIINFENLEDILFLSEQCKVLTFWRKSYIDSEGIIDCDLFDDDLSLGVLTDLDQLENDILF